MGQAYDRLEKLEATTAAYRASAEAKIAELEVKARPPQDIPTVSLKQLPEGYILWFHSHVNPQASPEGTGRGVEGMGDGGGVAIVAPAGWSGRG